MGSTTTLKQSLKCLTASPKYWHLQAEVSTGSQILSYNQFHFSVASTQLSSSTKTESQIAYYLSLSFFNLSFNVLYAYNFRMPRAEYLHTAPLRG